MKDGQRLIGLLLFILCVFIVAQAGGDCYESH